MSSNPSLRWRALSKALFLSLLLATLCPAAWAQEPDAGCPTVSVSCRDSVVKGTPLTFTVDVSGGDPEVEPTYNWTVSAGSIISGQGTSSIILETANLGGQSVTATVDVGGYARHCLTSDSGTTMVLGEAGPAVKFAEYMTPDLSANTAQLEAFGRALQLDLSSQGYIISYGGRDSGPDDAQKAADNATDYTMNVMGIDGSRTLSGVGGYREQPTVELWIAPPGGSPPLATPTVKR